MELGIKSAHPTLHPSPSPVPSMQLWGWEHFLHENLVEISWMCQCLGREHHIFSISSELLSYSMPPRMEPTTDTAAKTNTACNLILHMNSQSWQRMTIRRLWSPAQKVYLYPIEYSHSEASEGEFIFPLHGTTLTQINFSNGCWIV